MKIYFDLERLSLERNSCQAGQTGRQEGGVLQPHVVQVGAVSDQHGAHQSKKPGTEEAPAQESRRGGWLRWDWWEEADENEKSYKFVHL